MKYFCKSNYCGVLCRMPGRRLVWEINTLSGRAKERVFWRWLCRYLDAAGWGWHTSQLELWMLKDDKRARWARVSLLERLLILSETIPIGAAPRHVTPPTKDGITRTSNKQQMAPFLNSHNLRISKDNPHKLLPIIFRRYFRRKLANASLKPSKDLDVEAFDSSYHSLFLQASSLNLLPYVRLKIWT